MVTEADMFSTAYAGRAMEFSEEHRFRVCNIGKEVIGRNSNGL